MKKQNAQLVILGILFVAWGVSIYFTRFTALSGGSVAAKAAKAAQQENALTTRFHRIRGEMDGLYHYRLKPVAFRPEGNPFRLPGFMETDDTAKTVAPPTDVKVPAIELPASGAEPAESGESLLKHAVAVIRIGGVVTMNDTTELTVNGELHKEGEVFTARVNTRLVLIRIKRLATNFVILALDDPAAGKAETRVRLN